MLYKVHLIINSPSVAQYSVDISSTIVDMKIDDMDIYELLKEENQQFWDFLDLDSSMLNLSETEIALMHENYIVEEIETT